MIAILGALEGEISAFVKRIKDKSTERWNGRKIYSGVIDGKEFLVTWTGVGKIFSAAAVQHIIDIYKPETVFFTGIGGGLDSDLETGDMVIAEKSVIYDFDITFFGMKRGEIPVPGDAGNGKKSIRNIFSERDLVVKAESFKPEGYKVVIGTVFTGDSFITEDNIPGWIMGIPGSVADMEGGAAGLVCMDNNVPFFLVRIVADTPGKRKIKNFRKFTMESSEKLYQLVEFLVKKSGMVHK